MRATSNLLSKLIIHEISGGRICICPRVPSLILVTNINNVTFDQKLELRTWLYLLNRFCAHALETGCSRYNNRDWSFPSQNGHGGEERTTVRRRGGKTAIHRQQPPSSFSSSSFTARELCVSVVALGLPPLFFLLLPNE